MVWKDNLYSLLVQLSLQTASAKLEFHDVRELLARVVSQGWAPAEVTDLLDVVKVDIALMWPAASPLSLWMFSISLVQVKKLLRKRRK